MKFDTSKKWLQTLFKPYEEALLKHIWESNIEETGITSGQAHQFLQQTGNNKLTKSRASVIIFLNQMVEEGLLSYEEKSGKGGHHKIYYPKMNKEQFAQHAIKTITMKLGEVFPSIQVIDTWFHAIYMSTTMK